MALIYFADDDEDVRFSVKEALVKDGHRVTAFDSGEALLRGLSRNECDLVVLDIMMPSLDGMETLKKIRSFSFVPVILLTAKSGEEDFQTGVLGGADDYIVKPFRPTILRGKVHALLRRVAADHTNPRCSFGNMVACGNISAQGGGVYFLCNGTDRLPLTQTEGRYLFYLMQRFNQPVSRKELLENIWGFEEGSSRVVDETNRRLRNKLVQGGANIAPESIWGFGYVLKEWNQGNDR